MKLVWNLNNTFEIDFMICKVFKLWIFVEECEHLGFFKGNFLDLKFELFWKGIIEIIEELF